MRAFFILLLPILTFAQSPTIGIVEIYGNRRVTEAEIRRHLTVTEGSDLPASKRSAEDRLIDEIELVNRASLTAVCCSEDRKLILYVGVTEGQDQSRYRPPPQGELEFPQELTEAYRRHLERARKLPGGESTSEPEVASLADARFDVLRTTLQHSANDEDRAVAAFFLGRASRKSEAVTELEEALRDPDEAARGNAARALSGLANQASKLPELATGIHPEIFLDLLTSPNWTERTEATRTLLALTESRDPALLRRVRGSTLASLAEMARWKTLSHARPAFFLLARSAGLEEQEIERAWTENRGEQVIEHALSADKQSASPDRP